MYRQRRTIAIAFALSLPVSTLAQGINEQDAILESSLSPARLGKQLYRGAGITDTVLISSLAAFGTNVTSQRLYSEPDATDITTYTVKPGDNLGSIAEFFKVSVNTIRWQNDIKRNQSIKVGQQLIILPVSGVMHKVKKGDTLARIAKLYGSTTNDIKNFNDIQSDTELVLGVDIIIPNGEKQEEVAKPKSIVGRVSQIISNVFVRGKWNTKELVVNNFMHPTKFNGLKTQGYHHEWRAIDIGLPTGSTVYASRNGVVKIANKSGYGGGYGHYVFIEHPDGSGTMYAHMNKVQVSPGQRVSQGEKIGTSGNTGRSTGPHLHFEIRPPKGKSVLKWFPIPW